MIANDNGQRIARRARSFDDVFEQMLSEAVTIAWIRKLRGAWSWGPR